MNSVVNPLLLRVAQLIDGTGAAPRRDQEVLIADGRIEAIRAANSVPLEPGARVLERPDATALPGLIDSHVHLTFGAGSSHEEVRRLLAEETDEQLFVRALANAQAHLAGGVTSLRDCGGRGFVTLAVRDATRGGRLPCPRIAACGPAITTPGGHLHYLGGVAEGPEGVGAAARRHLERGADFLKICATGGIMTPESDPMQAQYTMEELRAAVEEAEAAGRLVAAHALSREGLERCVAAGVRSIEHCLWQTAPGEFAANPSVIERMREQNVVAGLTFAAISQSGTREARGLAAGADKGPWKALLARRFVAERAMIDAGVAYTVHSDAGVRDTPFGEFWVCLAAMVHELELPPLAAIRAATATPAALLGWADRTGALQVGKAADLLLVEGDPLADLEALARPSAVYREGRLVAGGGRVCALPEESGRADAIIA